MSLETKTFVEQISERDVDLLLLEEFHTNPEFVRWIASRVGLNKKVEFGGAWHSVVNTRYGETDLLLRLQLPSGHYGVLIENKITAMEMPDQDGRYHLRGQAGVADKHFQDFTTCIVAPRKYLDGVADTSKYQHQIPYEDIRDWLSAQDGARARWRAYILDAAVAQSRRGYTPIPDDAVTAFQYDYWRHVCAEYPKLSMKRPATKGAKSSWPYLKSRSMKPGVSIIHKTEVGVVDLSYSSTDANDLAKHLTDRDADMEVLQTRKSAVVRLHVGEVDRFGRFSDQTEAIDRALKAAVRLADLYEREARKKTSSA